MNKTAVNKITRALLGLTTMLMFCALSYLMWHVDEEGHTIVGIRIFSLAVLVLAIVIPIIIWNSDEKI